jgi:hypothetical protein
MESTRPTGAAKGRLARRRHDASHRRATDESAVIVLAEMTRMRHARTVVFLLVAAVACRSGADSLPGAGPTSATPTYALVAGTYKGTLADTTGGFSISLTVTLTVSQSAASLTGSYSMPGTISDGVATAHILGSGFFTGSIAAGPNPAVNIALRETACPASLSQFSGTYDSARGKLTLSGPVDILKADCSFFIRYNSTIVLSIQ